MSRPEQEPTREMTRQLPTTLDLFHYQEKKRDDVMRYAIDAQFFVSSFIPAKKRNK